MILLLRRTAPWDSGRWPGNVRPVEFPSLYHVPQLLSNVQNTAARTTFTRSLWQQQPRVETAAEVQHEVGHDDRKGELMPLEISREVTKDEVGEEDMSNADHEEKAEAIRARAAIMIQDAYRRHSEQKRTKAARRIQDAYRRHLKRKKVICQGIKKTKADFWNLLRKGPREAGLCEKGEDRAKGRKVAPAKPKLTLDREDFLYP